MIDEVDRALEFLVKDDKSFDMYENKEERFERIKEFWLDLRKSNAI